jgi:hypothetical protein
MRTNSSQRDALLAQGGYMGMPVKQRGFISWADIGMALVAVLLFLALLVMVTDR